MTDTLATWTPDDGLVGELARALGERRYAELPELARRAARCVLADPAWSRNTLAPVFVSVDELVFSLRPAGASVDVPAKALIAIVDLIDVIECLGAPLRSTCSVIARSWLGELGAVAGLERLRVAMAAFAWNDLVVAERHLGVTDVSAGYDRAAAFTGDLGAAVRHVMGAARAGDKMFAVEPMLESVVLAARQLGLDEPTLLWLARLVFRDVGCAALGDVTAKAHGFIRDVLADFAARSNEEPGFPIGARLAGGMYRVDEHVAGEGFQRLYLGHRVGDGTAALIAMDMASKHDPARLAPTLARRGPGILELVYLGPFDGDARWASVELAPDGDWLPHRVPRGQRVELATGIALARSAGHLLEAAMGEGSVLARTRPEYMWARAVGGVLEVVGLTDRGDAVTSNPTADGAVVPMFDRDYLAPEAETGTADERSLVFTLAAITAEWLTGRYPFASTWSLHADGPRLGSPLPVDLPSRVASILVRALSHDPAARPTLVGFIDDLATCV